VLGLTEHFDELSVLRQQWGSTIGRRSDGIPRSVDPRRRDVPPDGSDGRDEAGFVSTRQGNLCANGRLER